MTSTTWVGSDFCALSTALCETFTKIKMIFFLLLLSVYTFPRRSVQVESPQRCLRFGVGRVACGKSVLWGKEFHAKFHMSNSKILQSFSKLCAPHCSSLNFVYKFEMGKTYIFAPSDETNVKNGRITAPFQCYECITETLFEIV